MKKIGITILIFFSCQYCSAQYWQPLQSGLEWYTTCLYSDSVSNELFVGGRFLEVDNNAQWGIATYNGNAWSALGSGIDDASITNRPAKITSFVQYNSEVYVGGWFTMAGGLNTPAFAQWDGMNWDTVPGALMKSTDIINDMLVYNGELYICGGFDSVENVPANCIAKWNGTTWSAIGPNYSFLPLGSINDMAVYRGNLYVSGWFFDPLNNYCLMAKWDGSNWTFFSNAFSGGPLFYDMEVYHDKLYVSGSFNMPAAKCGIMTWNDTAWSGVGGGVQIWTNPNPEVRELEVHDNKLYCVGNFERIGGIPAYGLASWNDTTWCGYNTFFADQGQDVGATNLAFFQDTLYVGGGFVTVNGDTMNYISKWTGGNYVDTCGYLSTDINTITTDNNVLVYPNPADHIITIQFSPAGDCHAVVLHDIFGREVRREETNEAFVSFPVEDLADGVYFYSVHQKGGAYFTGKFIVKH